MKVGEVFPSSSGWFGDQVKADFFFFSLLSERSSNLQILIQQMFPDISW